MQPRYALLLLPALLLAPCAITQRLAAQSQAAAESARAGTSNPSAENPSLAQARALLEQNAPQRAERITRTLLSREPKSGEAHFLLGYILFREIQADVAAGSPSDQQAYLEMRDRRARASLAEYTEGAKYREPQAFDLKLVSLDYVLLGDYQDAGKWLSASLARDSSDAQAWYYLGRIRYKQAKYSEAIQAFHQALVLDPKNAKTEDNLGLVYQRLGQSDDAIAAYRSAIAWSQTDSAASDGPWFDLGSLLRDLHRTDEALPILRQALAVNPNDERTHATLATIYQSLDKWQEAQAELEKAVQLSPHAAHLHYLLGRAYQKNGLAEKARSEFATASALNAHGTSFEDDALDP